MLTIHFGEKPSLQLGGLGGQPNLLISIANTMVIFYFFIFIFLAAGYITKPRNTHLIQFGLLGIQSFRNSFLFSLETPLWRYRVGTATVSREIRDNRGV